MIDLKKQKEQIAIADELQLLWLQRMKQMLVEGTITSTDMATLAKFLRENGYTVDPKQLPNDLRSMLTKDVKFDDDLEGDRKLRLG